MKISEVQNQSPGFCKDRCRAGRFGACMAYIDNPERLCIMPDVEEVLKRWEMETGLRRKVKKGGSHEN